jgi:membrane protease YdiL (CAAX protease family)
MGGAETAFKKCSARGVGEIMKRYPLLSFFLLTFGITWGLGGLYFLFPSQIRAISGTNAQLNPLFFLAAYGPMLSALIVIGSTQGISGLRAYLRRLLHWRVNILLYLLILVGIPALHLCSVVISYMLETSNIPAFSVSPWYMILPVAISRLIVDPGATEELGWRGFALPLLQSRFSALWSSIILGSIWALWHLPAFFISGLTQTSILFPIFFLVSICLAILMTAIYNRTGGSIPLMILFHWQINDPFRLSNLQGAYTVMALLLVILAMFVIVVSGPQHLGQSKVTEIVPTLPKTTD